MVEKEYKTLLDVIKEDLIARKHRDEYNSFIGVVKSFSIGASASAIGATTVYPIDLLKTRLQATKGTNARGSSLKIISSILKSDGIFGFYKGLIPQLVGQVPEKAMRLFLVDQIRKRFTNYSSSDAPNYYIEIFAGVVAGFSQVTITNPAEILKVRLQVSSSNKRGQLLTLLREMGGLKGFYRGASACYLRDIPFSGLYFPVYAFMKECLRNPQEPLDMSRIFLSSCVAGVVASGLTTPADVIKTRMQASKTTNVGFWKCVSLMYTQEGISSFFKGIFPRVARTAPQYGVMLLAYEYLQSYFNPTVTSGISNQKSDKNNFNPSKDRWVPFLLLEDKMGILLENNWEAPSSFTQFESGFKHITVGSLNSVWAVSRDKKVYWWAGENWELKPRIKLKQISAARDGSCWGIKPDGSPMKYNIQTNRFERVPSKLSSSTVEEDVQLSHVSVGSEQIIWAISPKFGPVKYTNNQWEAFPNGQEDGRNIKLISCGADGTAWAVGEKNSVYRFDQKNKVWKKIQKEQNINIKQISVGNALHVWGVDDNDAIYKRAVTGVWQKVKESVPGQRVSVGSDGVVAAIEQTAD